MIDQLKIKISGRNPDYFIKKIIQKNINIYDLEKRSKEIILVVNSGDYQKIKDIKTTYKIEIIDRIGVSKYKFLFSKYFVFFICFLGGIILNIFLSNVIFQVEVIHSNKRIRELVLNDLEGMGIKKFNFKVSFEKKEKIKDKILNKEEDDLEWLEIEEVGTKYVVRVEQRKKNVAEDNCKYRNIVAKKDAMILEIDASEGEVVKKKLDYVLKGDVLICGLIHNKEEVMSKRCAKGRVFGEVWYKVNLELPSKYHEENVTGKKKSQVEIQFLEYEFSFFNTFKTYQKDVKPILESRLLPIKIQVGSYLETEVIDKNYTTENVDGEALKLAEEKIKDKLIKDDVILSKKVLKKQQNDSKIVVEVFVKVREDITDYQDITNIDISELNEKKE